MKKCTFTIHFGCTIIDFTKRLFDSIVLISLISYKGQVYLSIVYVFLILLRKDANVSNKISFDFSYLESSHDMRIFINSTAFKYRARFQSR